MFCLSGARAVEFRLTRSNSTKVHSTADLFLLQHAAVFVENNFHSHSKHSIQFQRRSVNKTCAEMLIECLSTKLSEV